MRTELPVIPQLLMKLQLKKKKMRKKDIRLMFAHFWIGGQNLKEIQLPLVMPEHQEKMSANVSHLKLYTAAVYNLLCMKNGDTQWTMISYSNHSINKNDVKSFHLDRENLKFLDQIIWIKLSGSNYLDQIICIKSSG